MPTINAPGLGAVTYEEAVPGLGLSPVYSLANGNSRVERTYRVAWGDRDKFSKAVLGFPRIKQNLGDVGVDQPFSTYLSRSLPHAVTDVLAMPAGNNDFDNKPFLYATAVTRCEGRGPFGTYGADGVPAYEYAVVTVQYESVSYQLTADEDMPEPDAPLTSPLFYDAPPAYGIGVANVPDEFSFKRFVTRTHKPSVEYLSLPRGLRRWVDNTPQKFFGAKIAEGTLCDFGSSIISPSTEVVWTWHQVPFVPEAARRYLGKVNLYAITEPTGLSVRPVTYLPGTLLLLGVEIRPYRTGAGVFVQDLVYRFKHLDPDGDGRGHNFFWRYISSSNRIVRVKLTDNGLNDQLIIPRYASDPVGSPYLAALTPAEVFPVRRGRPIYDYVDFQYLFTFKLPA